MKAVVLMSTPCTKSLGGGSEGHKRQCGDERSKACSSAGFERFEHLSILSHLSSLLIKPKHL